MPTGRPAVNEYAPYHERYVSLVPEADAVVALERQTDELGQLSVSEAREGFRYAADKWSVRQVIGHLVDAERVFGYRLFCISRGEQAALPSFDENAYVAESRYAEIPMADLVRELLAVRATSLVALRRLGAQTWLRQGTASGKAISVRALAYVVAGHARHHLKILRDRYSVG